MGPKLRAFLGILAVAALFFVGASWYSAGANSPAPGDLPAEQTKKPLRVLFIGNSMTDSNDMPNTIRHLAAAGSQRLRLEPGLDCPHGVIRFYEHCQSPQLKKLLAEGSWDRAVLNENSAVPSLPASYGEQEMYPYGRLLVEELRRHKVRPLLLMTWGFRDGMPPGHEADGYPSKDTFGAMTDRLAASYESLSDMLQVPVAPVGLAWREVRRERPGLELYTDDHHPSPAGSYLAACILYKMLFPGATAEGNTYHAGLKRADAAYLQKVADRVVAAYPRAQRTR